MRAPRSNQAAIAKRVDRHNQDVGLRGVLFQPIAEFRRFSKQFVRQWLGMHLLDYLHVDGKVYPQFDEALREAMREEPVAFFHETLRSDLSVLEFLHADFYEVALDKPIQVKVHVELVGVPVGVKTHGGLLEFVTRELLVSCLPLDIPKKFSIDITALEIGGEVRVSAVPAPDKVKIMTDGDLLVAHVVAKHAEEAAAATDAPAAAEPEVAKKGKAPAEGDAAAGKDAKKK